MKSVWRLNVAGGQETVQVEVDTPVIDTQSTVVSSVIAQEQIEHLPINGRNFIGFSLLAPGVATDRTPQQGASGTSGLSFAGQRARSNNITVDGLDNNDSIIGAVRATFSQEAVREFQVLTNSYSAEFGKASGGVVNIVTKSGTNEFAGNLFFFLRDGSLNSKDHFERFNPARQAIDRDKAPYSQKQYGATLGGPIRRDRTFFFRLVRAARHRRQQLRDDRRHEQRDVSRPELRHAGGDPPARRVPDRDGPRAVRRPLQPASRESRSSAEHRTTRSSPASTGQTT